MHAIETVFIKDEQRDHDACRHADGQPEYIQEAVRPVPVQVSEGRLEIGSKHSFLITEPVPAPY